MPPERTGKLRNLAEGLLLAAAYFFAAKWGLTLAFVHANATAVWPPTGIALAALVLGGLRLWPGVFLGAFLANLFTAGNGLTSFGIASGNTLEAVIGATLIVRFTGGREAFNRYPDILKFALIEALVATPVSATLGVSTLFLSGFSSGAGFKEVWLTWWLGDLSGALVVAPVILLWAVRFPLRFNHWKALEAGALAVAFFLTAWFEFGGWSIPSARNYPIEFLFIPLLLWTAMRFGGAESATATLALSFFSIFGTLLGFGPFHRLNDNASLLVLQGFMSVMSVTILVLASAVEERRRTEEDLRWSHSGLQLKVLERTEELQKANLSLEREVEERRRLSLLVETSTDFICLTALDGHMLYLNGEGRRLVGLGPEEDISSKLHQDFVAASDVPRLMDEVIASLISRGHWEGEFQLRHFKTGDALPFHFTAVLIKDPVTGQPQALAGIGRDIALQKLAQKAIEEREERLRLLVENIQDYAIFLLDAQGKVVTWNAGAQRIKGYNAQEIIGQPFTRFYPNEDVQEGRPQKMLQLAAEEGRVEEEGWHVRKDGTRFWANSILTVLRDETGGVRGFAKITRDITQRKKMEELTRSNRELEQFAYVASHDLQEPLRMVTSFVQLLARKYENRLDPEADQYIHEIVDGAARMRSLILDLLTYSRLDSAGAPFGPVDCGKALDLAVSNLQVALTESGARVTHGPLPRVRGDFHQITQLFQNLLANAVKFHGPEPPRIRVEAVERGGEWLFSVKDNGIGIDAKYSEQIFEIFKRLHTRSEYPGTGIGLAICKKVVGRHGGRIWVESELGRGATFYWTLPVLEEVPVEA